MKKGKTSKLSGFRNSKITYGTVDSKNFKSLYLNLQTWVEPKKDVENWTRVVLNMNRSIKHSIFNNIDKQMFDEKFIVDMDLRTSGLALKKKSFMNLEINLYLIGTRPCALNEEFHVQVFHSKASHILLEYCLV